MFKVSIEKKKMLGQFVECKVEMFLENRMIVSSEVEENAIQKIDIEGRLVEKFKKYLRREKGIDKIPKIIYNIQKLKTQFKEEEKLEKILNDLSEILELPKIEIQRKEDGNEDYRA